MQRAYVSEQPAPEAQGKKTNMLSFAPKFEGGKITAVVCVVVLLLTCQG